MCNRCDDLEEQVAYWKAAAGALHDQDILAGLRVNVGLSGKQAMLLDALHRRKGRPVRTSDLLDLIGSAECTDQLIKVFVTKIRQKLGRDAIRTERAFGYAIGPAGSAAIEAASLGSA